MRATPREMADIGLECRGRSDYPLLNALPMNTQQLVDLYLAKRRIVETERRRRSQSALSAQPRQIIADLRAADREAASVRVFEAIRASVTDSPRWR